MKDMYSYLVSFHLLDNCYKECKDNDFACFLGAACPENFVRADGRPADIAIYADWVEANSGKANMANILQLTYAFLDAYGKQYGFDFSGALKILLRITAPETLEEAQQYAEKMYQKYDYTD